MAPIIPPSAAAEVPHTCCTCRRPSHWATGCRRIRLPVRRGVYFDEPSPSSPAFVPPLLFSLSQSELLSGFFLKAGANKNTAEVHILYLYRSFGLVAAPTTNAILIRVSLGSLLHLVISLTQC